MFIGAAGVIKSSMAQPQLLLAWSVLRVLKYLCSLRGVIGGGILNGYADQLK